MAGAERPGRSNYNYENTAPDDKRITQQPTVRVDYQLSSRLRLTARYTGQLATVKPTVGHHSRLQRHAQNHPFIYNPAATVNYTFSPTLFLEGTYGFIQNQLGTPIINRPRIAASSACATSRCCFRTPAWSTRATTTRPSLEDIDSPMFVDGRILLPPFFSWGNRIANPPPNLIYPALPQHEPDTQRQRHRDQGRGRHTFKAGFYWYSACKAENLGIPARSPFTGALNFGNDANNPLDSGFGYANAALGVFSAYSQQSKFIEGELSLQEHRVVRPGQLEGEQPDDARLRPPLHPPAAAVRFAVQASNFFPDQWSLSNAPQLYLPGCSVAASPCPTASASP